MFWLTQCFVFTKPCASILQSSSLNWSLKLVILWLWSQLQPRLNQINFRGSLTFYFHYSLVSPPCFQLGAYCLGEQVMGPKKKTRHFLWFVQNPTLKGKLKECLCRKNITDLWECLITWVQGLLAQRLEKIPYIGGGWEWIVRNLCRDLERGGPAITNTSEWKKTIPLSWAKHGEW